MNRLSLGVLKKLADATPAPSLVGQGAILESEKKAAGLSAKQPLVFGPFVKSRRLIILISCVKRKSTTPAPAERLYTSDLFRKMIQYARSLNPAKIFILSALYGLVPLDRVIAPYEKTLKSMNVLERKQWAEKVLAALRDEADIEQDHFLFLAGKAYRDNLTANLPHHAVPMEGLSFGYQLKWLEENTLR